MAAQSICSKRLLRRLLVVFFLMFVLPSSYLLICISRFAFVPSGNRFAALGLRQSLYVGVPAIALMSVAALWLLLRSFSQLKQIVHDMRSTLSELESDAGRRDDAADEVTCISNCLARMKEAFLTRIAALDGTCERLQVKNERLAHVAVVDPETEVYNHKHAMKVLSVEVPRAIRHETPLSVLIIDVDDFAAEKHEHGAESEDSVLKEVATAIDDATRRIDMVARYGNGGFLVILPETNFNSATHVAERVRRTVSEHPFCAERGTPVSLTVSVGLATLDSIMDSEKLLARAEHSLMTAKSIGENMVLA